MEELDLAVKTVAQENPLVGAWMNWMGIIMLLSIVFVWKHRAARYILASMFLILPLGIVIFNITKNVHLIGIGHLLFWGPIVYYLCKVETKKPDFNKKSFYGVWIYLVLATMTVSILFDIRDIFLVVTGQK